MEREFPVTMTDQGQGGQQQGGGAQDWTAGLDQDARGVVQGKGWKSPGDAIKSYAELERAYRSSDKVQVPGRDAKPEDYDAFYGRIGRPQDAKGYEFQKPEGLQSYSQQFDDWFRDSAFKSGLTGRQAAALRDTYIELARQQETEAARGAETARLDGERALRAEWGPAYDERTDFANRAVAKFGGDELRQALQDTGLFNHPGLRKALAELGRSQGETGSMVSGAAKGKMSSDEARREIDRLRGDTEFGKAFLDRAHPGHAEAVRKHNELVEIANPASHVKAPA